jgi:membrane protein
MRHIWKLLKETASEWSSDDAPRLGASLAFYTMLSLGPLLLLAVSGAGLLFGEQAARGQIIEQLHGLIGPEGAQAIQDVLASTVNQKSSGWLATIVGVGTLLFGASGAFGELQAALNRIWNVKPAAGRGVWGIIKSRFFSFTMVLGTGFLLLVSLVVSAGLAALAEFDLGFALPGLATFWQLVNQGVGFGVITLLFAILFKFVPETQVDWRDVWVGAALTAALFTLGKLAIGLYLGHSAFSSTYGAAGSLIALLVWVYYSAQILFFGAEFTQVHARHRDALGSAAGQAHK